MCSEASPVHTTLTLFLYRAKPKHSKARRSDSEPLLHVFHSLLQTSFVMVKGAALFLRQEGCGNRPPTPTHHSFTGTVPHRPPTETLQYGPANDSSVSLSSREKWKCCRKFWDFCNFLLYIISGDLIQHLEVMMTMLRSEDSVRLVSMTQTCPQTSINHLSLTSCYVPGTRVPGRR